MKLKVKVVISVTYLISCLILIQSVFAKDNSQPTKSTINPDSIFYKIDRGLEKFFLKFQSDSSKTRYNKSLLEERFAELNYIASNRKLGQFETTSQRFSAQAGTLVDYVIANNLEKDQIRETLDAYKNFLPKLRDLYEANSSYWLLIQQDIDSLNLYIEKLK